MRRLIPAFIIDQLRNENFEGEFEATTVFVDIAGFTSMTQALMDNGKEGAEVLADSINAVFAPAIEVISSSGGFVSSFAGDAFTAVFPSDSVSVIHSLAAATRLQRLFQIQEEQLTKFGLFKLSVRIGVSCGSVSWGIHSQSLHKSYHFGGKAILHSKLSEQTATNGEVIVDSQIISLAGDFEGLVFQHKTGIYHTLVSVPPHVDFQSEAGICITDFSLQNLFIPDEVMKLPDRGEFRDIVSCFIAFSVEEGLKEGVSRLIALTNSFGGYFNNIEISGREGSILVLFGAPVNPGNLYNRAINYALSLQEISGMTVCIGLSYGTAFTGFVGSDLFCEYTALGSVVNLSARLTEGNEPSAVYMDHAIAKQAGSRFEILELEPGRFKGFSDMISVYRLAGKASNTHSSFPAGELIGRIPELNELTQLIQPLYEGRFGGVVYLYGNPGVGKSRLVNELFKHHGFRTAIMQTDSILRKPLNPFSYFFNQYFELNTSSTAEERTLAFMKKYHQLVRGIEALPHNTRILEDLTRVKSVISALVGLFHEGSVFDVIDPQDRAVATEQAIKVFFKALSLTEPVFILIEDIQWLDSASKDMLKILTRRMKKFPLVIIACSRFNDDGSKPELQLDDEVPTHSILLDRLPDTTTRELIEDRLTAKTDDELAEYIQSRTQGNPFYTEQFCLYLFETGAISLHKDHFSLDNELVDIPSDINMILIARIDRLSAELKEIVQIASVLGREFEVHVLKTLTRLLKNTTENTIRHKSIDPEIDSLIHMVENEKIWSALTEIRYIFNHALLRDAVYEMQLRTRLRSIHKLAGDSIAELYSDVETTFVDCAFHYEQAEDWNNALKYCAKAGEHFREIVRYDDALTYSLKALSISLEIFGKNHLETADLYNSIGRVYHEKSDYEKALSYHQRALQIRIELLGEKHFSSAESYSYIGEAYLRNGLYDTSLEYHNKALSIRKELLSENSVFTATSLSNIGEVYWNKGIFDKALEYHDKALVIRKDVVGEIHPSIATSYNNIGLVHSDRGDYDRALNYYEKALSIQKDMLGEKHPDTAASYSNIGMIHWRKQDYDTALTLINRALSIQIELLGEKQCYASTSYNNIGAVHYEKKDYDTALVFYEKALSIQKELLGEKHWYTAISIGNIGSVHFDKGDYSRALAFYEKALSIQIEQIGKKHPDTAISYYCIGLVYLHKGNNEKALDYLEIAYSIQRELLGEEHPHTIKTFNNIGVTKCNLGELETALSVFEKVYAFREEHDGSEHASTAMSLRDISSVFSAQGNNHEAEKLLKRALLILEKSLGEMHPQTHKCMQSLIDIYRSSGKEKEAKLLSDRLNDSQSY